jgi:hypothetical protein
LLASRGFDVTRAVRVDEFGRWRRLHPDTVEAARADPDWSSNLGECGDQGVASSSLLVIGFTSAHPRVRRRD